MSERFYRRLLPLLLIAAALFFFNQKKVDGHIRALVAFFQEKYTRFEDEVIRTYVQYMRQADTIAQLREENFDLHRSIVSCRKQLTLTKSALTTLLPLPEGNVTMTAVRPYSYAKLGNFQRFRLPLFKGYDPTKNYGVIRQGYAVGIVIPEASRPVMILAGDKFCMFAVYVGDVRAPGIASGLDEKHMIVKYISEWMKVRVGDEVYTSGLDHIFPPGIPVGRVTKIEKASGFKNARIELYGDTLHPDFVWVVRPSTTVIR